MEVEKITRALIGYLNDYHTFPEIQKMLKFCGIEISEREFATYVELYRQQEHEFYLESCTNGYRFTRDVEAINRSCNQRINKAVSMLKNAIRDKKVLTNRNQLALIDTFIQDYEKIMVVENV